MRKITLLLFPLFCLFSSGLEYTHYHFPRTSCLVCIGEHQSIHVLEVDPELYEIKPMKALDNGIGRESVLSIAERSGAIASINGGFFSIGGTLDGRACGALKIEDWIALPFKPRGCIGWSSTNQNPKIDRLWVHVTGSYDSSPISIHGLNRARKEGEAILYTPQFHRTTLTHPDGIELIVDRGIIQTIEKNGSAKIPENGFVLSIQKAHPLYNSFEQGLPLTVSFRTEPLLKKHDWDSLEYIVGGTPILILDNEKITDFAAEQTLQTFLTNRHARTAVGILPNGHWLFVVVDKTDFCDGMTMPELVDFMAKLGCIQALNLDGGGSSTLVYEGSIKNSPRGDEEESQDKNAVRRVSDAIVIKTK